MKKLILVLFVFASLVSSAQLHGLNRNYLDSCNISPAYFTGNDFYVGSQALNGQGVELSKDGTKMFVVDQTVDSVFQYTLSYPFSTATATYDNKSFYVGGQSAFPNDIFIRDDGLKFFVIDLISNIVFSYSLSSSNDISTMSYDNISFNSGSKVIDAYSIDFKKDGTKMYIVDVRVDSLYQYSITSWDVSTATYDNKSLYVKRPLTNTTRIRFCGSGDALYIRNSGVSFYQFNLGTSWDIQTSSGVGVSDISSISTIGGFDINSTNKIITTLSSVDDYVSTIKY